MPSEASGSSVIAHRTHTWVSHPGLHQCSQLLRSLTISSPVKVMGKHSFCITIHIRCRKTKQEQRQRLRPLHCPVQQAWPQVAPRTLRCLSHRDVPSLSIHTDFKDLLPKNVTYPDGFSH